MFVEEPAKASPLFGTPNFVSTPHLGASTTEAQVNVAIQVAEQMADFLVSGGVTNALNMPSLSAEEAPKLKPYMALAEKLGSLVGQLTTGAISRISVHTEGAAADLNAKPIVSAVLAGFLRNQTDTVNMVNAPLLARDRGVEVREVRTEREGDYHTLLRVSVKTADGERSVAGTLFGDQAPRWSSCSASRWRPISPADALCRQRGRAGLHRSLGTTLGEAGVNIGTFHLGRRSAGGEAVLLLSVDEAVSADLLAKVKALPGVKTAMGWRSDDGPGSAAIRRCPVPRLAIGRRDHDSPASRRFSRPPAAPCRCRRGDRGARPGGGAPLWLRARRSAVGGICRCAGIALKDGALTDAVRYVDPVSQRTLAIRPT